MSQPNREPLERGAPDVAAWDRLARLLRSHPGTETDKDLEEFARAEGRSGDVPKTTIPSRTGGVRNRGRRRQKGGLN
jgi:hypothetical protein